MGTRIGVNVEEMLVSQPDTGEQRLEICELLVRPNATNVIVVDSVAALIPKAEIEGEMGDSHVGLQARLMSQAMRKLTGAINRSDCTVIFINQIREKIGVMFGSPETTTGGRALKFYSSVRIDIRRIGSIKDGDKAIGNRAARWSKTRSHRHSNKPSSTSCSTKAFRGAATCWTWPSSKASVKRVVRGSPGETCMGQGRETAKQFLRDNPEAAAEIREKVLAARGVLPESEAEVEAAAEAEDAAAVEV